MTGSQTDAELAAKLVWLSIYMADDLGWLAQSDDVPTSRDVHLAAFRLARRPRLNWDSKAQIIVVSIYLLAFSVSFWWLQFKPSPPLPATTLGYYCSSEAECARRVMAPREHNI